MSDKNPLLQSNNIRIRHVLVACQYTRDAENSKKKLTEMNVGETFTGESCGGKCFVLVNEFLNNSFTISKASWDYNYVPEHTLQHSVTSNGYIQILDAVPGRFHNNLVNNVLYELEDYSIGNITFALFTYFTPPNYNETEDGIYNPKPYIFNVTNIDDTFTNVNSVSGIVKLNVTSTAFSLAQMPNVSKVYQTTITNIINESSNNKTSQEFGSAEIGTRRSDNGKFSSNRENRINKNKTMYTLKDVLSSFVHALNQQQMPHENQLQDKLTSIKESYQTKFGSKISQNIVKDEDYIPIRFKLNLDDKYATYEVDNINIPFEQSHIKKNLKGIKSLAIPMGMTVTEAIHEIMKLSSKVGKDYEANEGTFYKVILSTEKSCDDENVVTIKIRSYVVPNNVVDPKIDTGELEDNPDKLIFEVNNPNPAKSSSVVSFTTSTYPNVTEKVSELLNDTIDITTYGDIEQPTHFRNPGVKFNESAYNGFRCISPTMYKNYGLTDMISAEIMDNNTISQDIKSNLVIRGNPYLFSDVNRTPSEVSEDTDEYGELYLYTDYKPIYVKVLVHQPMVSELNQTDEPLFYYTGNYHVTRIVNVFNAGGFIQKLELSRNGDYI